MAILRPETIGPARIRHEIADQLASMTVYRRIHMFSLNMSLQDGAIPCGSLGITLPTMPVEIRTTVHDAPEDLFLTGYVGDCTISETLNTLRHYTRQNTHWRIDVTCPETLRAHTGLGTSTQILGGIALSAAKSAGIDLTYLDLFPMGFGRASNLGLSLLHPPGFILEHGYRVDSNGIVLHPHINSRPQMPSGKLTVVEDSPWHVIYGVPKQAQSISYHVEEQFWNNHLPEDREIARTALSTISTKVLPGLETDNFDLFLSGVTTAANQTTKQAEESLQAPPTHEALATLRRKYGFAAVSSLGPTIYAFSERPETTNALNKLSSSDYEFQSVPLSPRLPGDTHA